MPSQQTPQPGTPVLLGIPFDANSSYVRGAAGAPPLIREAFRSESSNSFSESGVELSAENLLDAGDLELPPDNAFAKIESAVGQLLDQGQATVCLGGDHSITYPIVRAFGTRFTDLTLVHFDAHSDLYEEFDGNRYSHACPFARIMEERCVKRLIQVGIRTMNAHQRKQADRFGVEVIEMRELPALERLKLAGPVYISFDIDVLDPAFAPGISHREPGGMSVREAIAHLHAIQGDIVGADIVEYNPKQDVLKLTAMVCAKILKEILGKMIAGRNGEKELPAPIGV
ncbi:MAG TPA: agmatinase [Terriglobales bacterium]|nr:agmatinase [Terriglobales bacterium]